MKFRCYTNGCHQSCWTRNGLDAHTRRVHGPLFRLKTKELCKVCGSLFRTKSDLESHYESVHKEKREEFHCYSCTRIFSSRFAMDVHNNYKHPSLEVECEVCGTLFRTQSELEKHKKHDHKGGSSIGGYSGSAPSMFPASSSLTLPQDQKRRMESRIEEGGLRIRRDRPDSLKKSPKFSYSDPDWIAEQLVFTTQRKKDTFCELLSVVKEGVHKRKIKVSLIQDMREATEELGEMIRIDPRLGDLIDRDNLMRLYQLLKHYKYPYLQAHVAIILKPIVVYSCNKDVVSVIKLATPVIVDIISSRVVDMVRVEALWLLRNLVFAIAKSGVDEEDLIEEALSPIISLIMKESIGYGVLDVAAATLSAICEVFPKFSPEKLKLALPALIKLIQSDVLTLLTSGCWSLALLCDGRKEMVVEEKELDFLIGRLVNLMNSLERIMVISALHVMGSIVRWGSDDVIEAIIEKDGALLILSLLLNEKDLYIVKQTCWILSNITGRKEKHIRAVIDRELIGPLVNVVQNCKLFDVREVAVWALSNALCGVGLDQIECLRNSCSMVSWYQLLPTMWDDRLCIIVTLEGLVNIKTAKITLDGRPVDGVELQSIFKKIPKADWHRATFSTHVPVASFGIMQNEILLFDLKAGGNKLVCHLIV